MRAFRRWVLALAAVAVAAAPVRAADDKDDYLIPSEGSIEVILLRQKSVQKELGVGPAESAKINQFTTAQWKKAKALRDRSPAERRQAFEKMARENVQFLDKTLTRPQLRRLFQIGMQVAGLVYVTDPRIAPQLKLTEAQAKKAREIQESARKEVRQFLQSKSPAERKQMIMQVRQANRKRLMSLLTDSQKAVWKELVGQPFKGEFHSGAAPSSK